MIKRRIDPRLSRTPRNTGAHAAAVDSTMASAADCHAAVPRETSSRNDRTRRPFQSRSATDGTQRKRDRTSSRRYPRSALPMKPSRNADVCSRWNAMPGRLWVNAQRTLARSIARGPGISSILTTSGTLTRTRSGILRRRMGYIELERDRSYKRRDEIDGETRGCRSDPSQPDQIPPEPRNGGDSDSDLADR